MIPELITYVDFAPTILRITLGLTMLHMAYAKIRTRHRGRVLFGMLWGFIGLTLLTGLLTPIASSFATIIFGLLLIRKMFQGSFLSDGVNYYLLLFVISLAVLLLGPGALAVDGL